VTYGGSNLAFFDLQTFREQEGLEALALLQVGFEPHSGGVQGDPLREGEHGLHVQLLGPLPEDLSPAGGLKLQLPGSGESIVIEGGCRSPALPASSAGREPNAGDSGDTGGVQRGAASSPMPATTTSAASQRVSRKSCEPTYH
jgi:hypothetical protein